VGDVDVEWVEQRIKTLFAGIPAKPNAGERPIYEIADNKEPIISVVKDKEARMTRIELEYKHKKLPQEVKLSMAGYLTGVINQMVSTMRGDRFDEITQRADAPFVGGYAMYGELVKSTDAFMLLVVPKEGHELEGLKYYRYQAIRFLVPDKKRSYKNADVISTQLAKIMKVLLVKRIDSSFYAFKQSLNRFKEATGAMIKMFDNGTVYIAPNLKVSDFIIEDREDELIDLISSLAETDPTISICKPDDFIPGFYEGLEKDYEILTKLVNNWKGVGGDPKLDEFLFQLKDTLLDKKINSQQKLVIFSSSKETKDYMFQKLHEEGYKDVLEVNSSNPKKLVPVIRENFDANIPRDQYRSDFNIIIATEVLAEGVNLHRSNVIVNYDTPWNSTRLMQRIGRVNRIGTVSRVHIFNLFPTDQVTTDIDLEKKAIKKLQAFHSALGEDSQIYSTDEETESFGLFDKTIQEEKDERLGYLMELRKFKEENESLFRKIKNMPLRARVGRKDRPKNETTICFIRNDRRDAFYWVRNEKELEEMTFVETAKEFRADPTEKSIPLHDAHHEHVNLAMNDFGLKIQAEASKGIVVDTTQGPNEKKALAYLDGFLNLPFISTDESNLIKAAKQAIKLGRYQKLQRDINALKKNVKKHRLSLLNSWMLCLKSLPGSRLNPTTIQIAGQRLL